ncbi:MAG: radical SAM protein, partial [Bryobacteraceae bacterium]
MDRFDFVEKLSHFPDRIAAVLDRRLSDAISMIYLDVNTDICNHACTFCDGYYRKLKAAEILWTRLERLIDEMSELGVLALVIAGDRGEPLLHSRFQSLLEKLNSTDVRYGIYTNGTGVKDSYLEPLRRASFVRISVDAAWPETHRRMHGYPASRHDFDEVRRNVELLSSIVADVGVSFILDADNVDEIEEAADVFLSRNARF